MIEVVIISKAIIACIVRRINVNQLYLSCIFLFKRMKGKEIVAFDNQVVIGRKMLHIVLSILVIATKVG